MAGSSVAVAVAVGGAVGLAVGAGMGVSVGTGLGLAVALGKLGAVVGGASGVALAARITGVSMVPQAAKNSAIAAKPSKGSKPAAPRCCEYHAFMFPSLPR